MKSNVYLNILLKNISRLHKSGALYIFIGDFLSKAVTFFGSIFIIRILSKYDYGTLSFIENIYSYLYLLVGFGCLNALFRYSVKAETSSKKFNYFMHSLLSGTFANLMLVLAGIFYILFITKNPNLINIRFLAVVVIITLPFHFLVDLGSTIFRARLENKMYATTIIIISALIILGKYVGALKFGLEGVVYLRFLIYFLSGLLIVIYIYNSYFKAMNSTPILINKQELKDFRRYSVYFMVTNSIWALFIMNDLFMLGLFRSTEVLAEFKVAYTLPANISLISQSIGVFIAPFFIKNENDYIWVWSNYIKALTYISLLTGTIALLLIFFSKELTILLFGTEYSETYKILSILTVASVINATFRYTPANLLASMGKVKLNFIVSISGLILQFILNLFFIPKYGSIGIAYNSVVTYSVMAISMQIIFIKIYRKKEIKL